jgi:hypothetical protein
MKSQKQFYYDAESKAARLNQAFLELINHPTNPLTKSDLVSLIARRPEQYSRFAGFLKGMKE